MKNQSINNITLIGMPGVGKSTMGVILAKELGYSFIDSDLLIQKRDHKLLSEIIDDVGTAGFLKIEDEVNSSINTKESVIATGGSAVYGEDAMTHLKSISTVIYLKLPYNILEKRLSDLHNRGVVVKEGQTLKDIYDERAELYEKYADIVVDETGLDIEGTLAKVLEELKKL